MLSVGQLLSIVHPVFTVHCIDDEIIGWLKRRERHRRGRQHFLFKERGRGYLTVWREHLDRSLTNLAKCRRYSLLPVMLPVRLLFRVGLAALASALDMRCRERSRYLSTGFR